MARIDLRVTESGDDIFINATSGDFDVFESDFQHQMDIIQGDKGAYKEFPALGVGAIRYLNSSGRFIQLRRSVRANLESDDYKLLDLGVNGSEISVLSELLTNE